MSHPPPRRPLEQWQISVRAWLVDFVRESNMIEGIIRRPTKAEIEAHERFLAARVSTSEIESFVSVVAPHARLRDKTGLNVRVGSHVAPAGGPDVRIDLEAIISDLPYSPPFHIHRMYETLHPFTDGNGRSGRALWLWQILNLCEEDEGLRARELGFLHTFYYQTLAAAR